MAEVKYCHEVLKEAVVGWEGLEKLIMMLKQPV
jgi:hypothetical protein